MGAMNNMNNKIRELISQCFDTVIPVEQISDDDNLFNLGMDSISSIKLIVAIESEFDFEFNDEALNTDNIKTINSIVTYIEKSGVVG